MREKALFIFVPGFPGGVEDTHTVPPVFQFCVALKRNYPLVHFLVFSFQYPFECKQYQLAGMEVLAFGGKNKKGLSRLILWTRILLKAWQLSRRYEVKGALAFWLTECALIGKLFSRFRKLPFKIWLQGQEVKAGNRYVKLVSPMPDELISFSDFVSDELSANYGIRPAYKITNSIDQAKFPPLNTSQREIDVMGCAWLNPNKNFGLFIEVIAALVKQGVQLSKVLIVGSGEEEKKLKEKVELSGLSSIISFTGHVAHPEALQLMNNSKVFLHTSLFDSNASVLHEALYAGCKVVSTCPIDPSSDVNFVLANDKEALTAALRTALVSDSYHRVSRPTFDDAARQMMQLFQPKSL